MTHARYFRDPEIEWDDAETFAVHAQSLLDDLHGDLEQYREALERIVAAATQRAAQLRLAARVA